MNTKELLSAFFEAENRRDWAAYRKYLASDVVWVLHSRQVKTISGIDDYLAAIMKAYEACDNTFVCEVLYANSNGTRIAAILRNNLGERSCDIFDFADDLIVREYEFLIE